MWNFLSSVATKVADTVPNPTSLPALEEDRVTVYAQHKISEADGKLIKKTVDENIDKWKTEGISTRFIEKRKGDYLFLPKSLWVYFNPDKLEKIKIYIHCEEAKLGNGVDMTYYKALEYQSLKTYAVGMVLFKGEVMINGTSRTAEDRRVEAEKLEHHFEMVNGAPETIQLKTLFSIHLDVEGRGFLTKCYQPGDLSRFLKEKKPLTERDIRQILINVASALRYLHEELEYAHFDVKPSNILLQYSEGSHTATLCDLGFLAPYNRFTGQGTPTHLPPEFWEKFPAASEEDYKEFDGRVFDQWAFGNVMKKMIDGDYYISDATADEIEAKYSTNPAMVFQKLKETYVMAENPVIDEEAPDTLEGLKNHLLQKNPKDRPQSMSEVLDKLKSSSPL